MKNTRAAQIIIKPVSPVFIVSSSLIILIWGTRYLILPWGRRYLSPPSPLSKQKRRQTNLFDSFDAFVVIYNSRLQKIMQEVILNCFSQAILSFSRSFLTKSLLSAQFRYTGLFYGVLSYATPVDSIPTFPAAAIFAFAATGILSLHAIATSRMDGTDTLSVCQNRSVTTDIACVICL